MFIVACSIPCLRAIYGVHSQASSRGYATVSFHDGRAPNPKPNPTLALLRRGSLLDSASTSGTVWSLFPGRSILVSDHTTSVSETYIYMGEGGVVWG